MRIDARRAEAFLADPGAVRIVLLHGEDPILVAERGRQLLRRVAGDGDDPFRVVALGRDQAGGLVAELQSVPLTGGRRVVHVRDASDVFAGPVSAALAAATVGFAVLEAGALTARSRLRSVVEAHPEAAAVGCYTDDAATLGRVLGRAFEQRRVRVEGDVLGEIAARMANRAAAVQEAEKLALFVGDRAVGRDDVEACLADDGAGSLEAAVFAAFAGEAVEADRAVSRAWAEGATPVSLLRAALLHVHRLERARQLLRSGASELSVAKQVRPPVAASRQPQLRLALRLWSERDLGEAAAALHRLERDCKRTGAPGYELSGRALLTCAGLAAAGAAAGRGTSRSRR
ncbi:MAG: DNA polymerase III subunit delta [Acidisphaera sp.]|nr:DNA polymerase III subunit delta [Acidisphaera sp.]